MLSVLLPLMSPNLLMGTNKGFHMNDSQMKRCLKKIKHVPTLHHKVRNDRKEILDRSVIVVSSRTGRRREIPFSDIRRAPNTSKNGCVCTALAVALGLLP